MKYWIRVWKLDWWGYWEDSPEFDTQEQAYAWQTENVNHFEDSVMLWREVDEVLGTDNQPIQS